MKKKQQSTKVSLENPKKLFNYFDVEDLPLMESVVINDKKQNNPFSAPKHCQITSQVINKKEKLIENSHLKDSKYNRKSMYIRRNNIDYSEQLKYSKFVKKALDKGNFLLIDVMGTQPEDMIKTFKNEKSSKLHHKHEEYKDYIQLQLRAIDSERKVQNILKDKVFKTKSRQINKNFSSLERMKKTKTTNKRKKLKLSEDLINFKENLKEFHQKLQSNHQNYFLNQKQIFNVQLSKIIIKALQDNKSHHTNQKMNIFQSNDVNPEKIVQQYRQISKIQHHSRPKSSTTRNYEQNADQKLKKYDLTCTQYFRKRSYKRIDRDYQKQKKDQAQNMIMQYQQFILNRLQLSQKNKQNILRCFNQINKQSERVKDY